VVFLDALPTTATGKVRRVELRTMAAGLLSAPRERRTMTVLDKTALEKAGLDKTVFDKTAEAT
jgi:hypothetical protein